MALLLSLSLLLLLGQSIKAAQHPAAFLQHPSNRKNVESTTCILRAEPKEAKGGDETTPSTYGAILQLERRQMLRSLVLVSPPILFRPPSVAALTVEQAETSYDKYAKNYDDLDGGVASNMLGIDEARSVLFRQAKGRVLEVGCGTGLNLDKYDPSKIRSLTLVDVSQGMLGEAQKRIMSLDGFAGVPVEFIKADATSELYQRFGERSFDTVVDSFSLCVMGNLGAKRCLDQMRQVAKTREDGGQILLLENSRSSNPLLGMYQDATADATSSMGGKGCVYNQDVGSLIRATAGMRIEKEEMYAVGLFRSFRCTVQ